MQTTYENDRYSGWIAKTVVLLGAIEGGQRLLEITTSKYGKKVRTAANVVNERGTCREYEIYAGYHKEMGITVANRVTEKVVRQAHEIALRNLSQVIDEARTHYTTKSVAA